MNPADKSDPTVLVHRQWLETHLKSRVFLTWTDNRTSMVSVSRHPATGYQLRLHHMFQVAPEGVWYALVQYFVESVVYHEMLHHLIPAVRIRGKWYNHPPAFKRAERQYPHYQKAQDWELKNLHRLLA